MLAPGHSGAPRTGWVPLTLIMVFFLPILAARGGLGSMGAACHGGRELSAAL